MAKSRYADVESVDQKRQRALAIITILQEATAHMRPPASSNIVVQYGRDPYLVLVACILSLRTRDTVSEPAACRLFEYAQTPQEMIKLSSKQIEQVIHPVGFFRQKTKHIQALSVQLISYFDGRVPKTIEELLTLPGVGRKTANLVLAEGFGIPAVCVDTHVHRISNRLGLVTTKTPDKTEAALRELLPSEYWIRYTRLLVMWGQNICLPQVPKCSICPVFDFCQRVGVTKSR